MSTGTISATLVRHPRRSWKCDSCGVPMGMATHLRMYGSADGGEKPYCIRICLRCADQCASRDAKVKVAIAPVSSYEEPPLEPTAEEQPEPFGNPEQLPIEAVTPEDFPAAIARIKVPE